MTEKTNFAADEMYDGEEDLGAPGRLGEFLRFCEAKILRPYQEADHRALGNQKIHRRVILAAAWLTTATLLVTAFNTVFHDVIQRTTWTLVAELVFASATAAVVYLGLRGHWQKKWLLDRYRAERYRLAKFELLTSASFWADGSTDWRPALETELKEIADLDDGKLDDEARKEQIARLPSLTDCAAVAPEDLDRLLSYYKRRRLVLQINYFEGVAHRKKSPWLLPFWLPAFFFASMICVVVHLGLDLIGRAPGAHHSEIREAGSMAFLFLSLTLPLVLSGMRLRHTANEVARNQNRSFARSEGLGKIAKRLGGLPEGLLVRVTETVVRRSTRELLVSTKIEGPADAAFVFSHLALAEQILESDQREWLRLMLEAEWYR
jgi:hypothetical protein